MSPPPGEVGESVPIPRARAGTLFPWLLCAACPTRSSMAASGAHPNRRPLLALILLSPVIAEMLSGSTPPIEWLNPIGVLFLIWLYGAGVLVMRETAVRWKTGWPSILLLGAAYGIIEEGLAVKSFFDPNWMDLGSLGWYGRWIDVNWIWAVWLTIFHAVISISVPIFLTEWIWPRIRGQPLTTRRGYITAIVLLAAAAVTINVLLTPYRPSAWHLVGSFLVYGGGPALGVYPIVTVLEGAGLLVGVVLLIRRTSGEPDRWTRQRFAFVAGCVGFLIVLAAFLELAGWRGMGVVAALFVYLFVRLYRRIPIGSPTPVDDNPRASQAAPLEAPNAPTGWESP